MKAFGPLEDAGFEVFSYDPTPFLGRVYYNSVDQIVKVYDGSSWIEIGSAGSGGGSGDVIGPGSATDHAFVRFDQTSGKLIQNSQTTEDDSGNVTTVGEVNGASPTEMSYLSGLSANVQSQLDGKQAVISLTANRAIISDGLGELSASDISSTEINYLDGVNANIQTQLDSKLDESGGTMSGPLTSSDTTQASSETTGAIKTAGGISSEKNMICGGQSVSKRFNYGNTGATASLDWNNGNVQSITLDQNAALDFSNPIDGGIYWIIVNQDVIGGRTLFFSASVEWIGGIAIQPNQDASSVTIYRAIYENDTYHIGVDTDAGQGIPAGGTTGQVLAKIDGTDYNTEWIDAPSGGGGGSAGYQDAGNSGTAKTIDWSSARTQKITLTDNVEFTFSNPTAGDTYSLIILQDSVGGRTVTWPASVKWPGGVSPSLSSGANEIDIVEFIYDGTTYYGGADFDYA